MDYLLDTNICIYLLKGKFDLQNKIKKIGLRNCSISEITYAELIYGAEKSLYPQKNYSVIEKFSNEISIIPIFDAIKTFAKEKVRLQSLGNIISDFDILIGATAIANKMIKVTRNIKEFNRLKNIEIENWVK